MIRRDNRKSSRCNLPLPAGGRADLPQHPPDPVRPRRSHVRTGTRPCALAAVLISGLGVARAQTIDELRNLSIEQLANIDVTSVSRSQQALADAPASVFVINRSMILASGATTIPELLRLAPNLEVAQLNASSYAISARGFNVGLNASLSNKLLVMIDGRSIYSPMFGGVYWDMIDVLPENIERIEVISGPGAALWGANAVDGVINIITRSSAATQGGLLTLGAGNLERYASLQYGGRLSPELTYRVNTAYSNFSALSQANGQPAGDPWNRPQGGFRLDWTPPDNTVTLQGDVFDAKESSTGFIRGYDLSGYWRHAFSNGSSLTFQTFVDQQTRGVNSGSSFTVDTVDVSFQHNFRLGDRNDVVWGVGEHAFRYTFENTALALNPPRQTLSLANLFAQDTFSLTPKLKVTAGLKLEDEPYAGLQAMPSLRLAWKPVASTLLWAAVSRAVRSPTPVDVNLEEFAGPTLYLAGSDAFRPEVLTAYEIGTRVQVSPRFSFSLSGYYDVYDDLRSIDPGLPPTGLPLVFGNLMSGSVLGLEAWAGWQVTHWWRLSVGISALHENLRFAPGSLRTTGLAFVADDPSHQATILSSVRLARGVVWTGFLREVAELPHPEVPGYVELNTSIAWDVTDRVQLSLSGFNLLHARHQEFIEPGVTSEIPRSVFAQMRVRF